MQNSDSFVRVQVWADLMKSSKHSRNFFQSYIILQPPTFDLSPSYISFVLVNTIYISSRKPRERQLRHTPGSSSGEGGSNVYHATRVVSPLRR
jgi:hypothetical protein